MDFKRAHALLDEWLFSHYQTDIIDVRMTMDEMGLMFKKRRNKK